MTYNNLPDTAIVSTTPWKNGARSRFTYQGPPEPFAEHLRDVERRSGQTVTIVEELPSDGFGGPEAFQERMDQGQPYLFKVRFADGYEAVATEDELSDAANVLRHRP